MTTITCQFCQKVLLPFRQEDVDDLLQVFYCSTCQVDFYYWINSNPLSKSHHSFIIHDQHSYEWVVNEVHSILYLIQPIRKIANTWKREEMIIITPPLPLTPQNVLQKLKTYLLLL